MDLSTHNPNHVTLPVLRRVSLPDGTMVRVLRESDTQNPYAVFVTEWGELGTVPGYLVR